MFTQDGVIETPQTFCLLDAAQIDVKDGIFLAAELKAVEKGSVRADAGRGPFFSELKKRMHHRELNQAVQLGKDIFTLSGFHVDPDSSHRPPSEEKQKKKGMQKNV